MSAYREPAPRAARRPYRAPRCRARYGPRLRDLVGGRLGKRVELLRHALAEGFVAIHADLVPRLYTWLTAVDELDDALIDPPNFATFEWEREDEIRAFGRPLKTRRVRM